ncbi:RNA polymerase sigma factor SigJ [Flavitalea sp. BT771]|uniref:RNA polymerase sigma factor SigJ n=1 Tax=Flavitalea sp. BT771 TaxID=3063329 RepID=UPI0026E355B2|nr:RNA polymerase sigma factor SigJ [Flavitalea sp. BT771]MDO6430774.1 RNA polymerase sigma factor SigJ [Flavitalea sp. BT771]MDV6219086.1 RNA polymerase sigma factor SigJ [Flavitalea sp. BT771]
MDNKTDTFLEYKALLFSIAYNMLGNIDQAEDMVQDTYLKWMEIQAEAVKHTKAFLVKVITNKCINHLSSAKVQREKYVGIWLPEPLQDYSRDRAHNKIETYHALSIGMLVLMERLTPQERAIFLLKEIFSYDYYELAEIFEKAPDNCRQILKRAKDNLGKDTRRFEVDMKVHEKILKNFMAAISEGSMEELIQLLKEDIHLFADGGGRSFQVQGQRLTAFARPIQGRENIGRLLLSIVPKFRQSVPDFSQEFIFTNGMPSIISYSGDAPQSLVSLEIDDQTIRNIYVQTNPDKLKHLKKTDL